MVRLDLQFLLCCCRACLGSPNRGGGEEESYYSLLNIDRDATPEDIKKAYKRQSLLMHPDKLAQKGQTVTEADQARFTRMKEAYEVLSDPHKRETYDAIGERGMKWLDQPFSMDPKEMAHNFASSSTLDRAKIFSIFLFLAVAILIQPLLLALQIDGKFGEDAKWVAVLVPIWLWSAFIAFYHVRVIMLGPISRPEHIPEEEWEDPLPMSKRVSSLFRFLLFFAFEIQVALHLDGNIAYPWSVVFIPIFILETWNLIKVYPKSKILIISSNDLENLLGKPISELSLREQKDISKKFIIVPPQDNPMYFSVYDSSMQMIRQYKQDFLKIILRIVFVTLLVIHLDNHIDWSWWIIFSPFFVASLCACWSRLEEMQDIQSYVGERLNRMSATVRSDTDYGTMEEGNANNNAPGEGEISEEEQNLLKAHFVQSTSRAFTTCVVQTVLIAYICVAVFKISGAGITSFWFITPILSVVSLVLCCLGCMIFCVSPMEEGEMDMDLSNPAGEYHNMEGYINPYNPPFSTVPEPYPSNVTDTKEIVVTTTVAQESTIECEESMEPSQTPLNREEPNNDLLDTSSPGDEHQADSFIDTINNVSEIGPTLSELEDLD